MNKLVKEKKELLCFGMGDVLSVRYHGTCIKHVLQMFLSSI